ncbi:AraC family transcriptional regulator [Paenalkalicoccus suaedae]|uniref:AraC family transcriptional regulator n=1 Tax=Paenalkalicoccus suaedae TaxID=2592382 RepID=A0A859FJK8_9BACI|nr:AraC family transcriptional regulator [Paenalkalicoccus suaedae]QKS72978.1 AraC family transcriptional regulator [Paenalkalicoccus suaedae]
MYFSKKRYTFSQTGSSLPLFVESVGYNPQELDFNRPEGYPHYHWLQTTDGEGLFTFQGQSYPLPKGRGIFINPYTPHAYHTVKRPWSTAYITFGGASVSSILTALELNGSAVYEEPRDEPLTQIIYKMMEEVQTNIEFSSLQLSRYLYDFLIQLKQHARANNSHSLSHFYEKVRPIVDWLEISFAEDIGLADIAKHANVSPQYLNRLFQETFSSSPYSFLVQLRIRKAKELLVASPDLPLNQVASLTGFKDVSHFVATFRRREQITPKQYRILHH